MLTLRSAASTRNLCRRNLAGGDGGSLCLGASRSVIISKEVLSTAEGGEHAVTELEKKTRLAEVTDRCRQSDNYQSTLRIVNTLLTVNRSVMHLEGFQTNTVRGEIQGIQG